MNPNSWIFFDLGGTLIDESRQEEYIADTVVSEFAKYGVMYSISDVYDAMRLASLRYKSVVKEAIRLLSETEEQYLGISDKAVYPHELESLFPRVIETLELLAKRYRLGVIANQDSGAEERLKKHHIHRYFSVFALSSELGVAKPDKRIFEYALRQAGCLPQNTYMVGDRLDNDIFPANHLNMNTIRVLQGVARYQQPLSEQYKPTYVLKAIGDLIHFAE
ncbi:MAG: HAD family hydrolase [Clostridia bacterium]|nr:HAD family hydrolase [Clostridia bacterium]